MAKKKSAVDKTLDALFEKMRQTYIEDDEEQHDLWQQRKDDGRNIVTGQPLNKKTTNSTTATGNSPQTTQTSSQDAFKPKEPVKLTGRNYTSGKDRYGDTSARGDSKGVKASVTNSLREKTGVNLKTKEDVKKYDEDYAEKLHTNPFDIKSGLTVTGAGKQWLGGQIASVGTTAQELETTANSYNQAKAEADNPFYSLRSREEAEKRQASYMDKLGVKEGVDIKNAERVYEYNPNSFSQRAINAGDKLIESGTQDIEEAKEGTGALGRLAIDLGANALQMGGDMALRFVPVVGQALSFGSLMNRAGGTASYEARQMGLNPDQQFTYQQGTALIEGLSERIFNSVSAFQSAYGKGAFDLAEKVGTRVASSQIVKDFFKTESGRIFAYNLAKLGASMFEEGTEELIADIAEPALKYCLTHSPEQEGVGGFAKGLVSSPIAENGIKGMAYDFMVGALMAGIPGSVDFARNMNAEVTSRAFSDGQEYAQTKIDQALVQGREGQAPTNAEILGKQLQEQKDKGLSILPGQTKQLEREIANASEQNAVAFEQKSRAKEEQAVDEGRIAKPSGTRIEDAQYSRGVDAVERQNIEKAKEAMGEGASPISVDAVGRVMAGTATVDDHDAVLADPKAKEAVEKLTGIRLSTKNTVARNALENITTAREIANKGKIRGEVQANFAEAIANEKENMSKRGGKLFADNYDEAVRKIGSGTVYESVFTRLYSDGLVQSADFKDAYDRIVAPLGEQVTSYFTKEFAQRVFDEGRASALAETAKAVAKNRADSEIGLRYEDGTEGKLDPKTAKLLEKFAKRTKVPVVLYEDKENNNGYYDPKTDTIYISVNSTNKLITVAKHELTHHIKATAPERYKELEDFVFERWYNHDSKAMEDAIRQKQLDYENISPEVAREEIIADASEKFFTDAGAINDAISFSKKLGRAIRDGIKTILDTFLDIQETDELPYRGYGEFLDELGILKEAERMWAEALDESVNGKRKGKKGSKKSKAEAKEKLDEFLEEHKLEKSDEPKKSLKVRENSDGEKISNGQFNFFKNSQAVDEKGRLVKLWHTTNAGGFSVFDPQRSISSEGIFFSSSFDVSQTYGWQANKPIVPGRKSLASEAMDIFFDENWGKDDVNKRLKVTRSVFVDDDKADTLDEFSTGFGHFETSEPTDLGATPAQQLRNIAEGIDNGTIDPEDYIISFDDIYNSLTDNNSLKDGVTADWFFDKVEDAYGGAQHGYYEVYLNLENPLVIDGHGADWNYISAELDFDKSEIEEHAMMGVNEFATKWIKDIDGNISGVKVTIKGKYKNYFSGHWETLDETKTFKGKSKRELDEKVAEYWEAEQGLDMSEYIEMKDYYQSADGEIIFDSPNGAYFDYDGVRLDEDDFKTSSYSTNSLARLAKDNGYDGVIIRNIADIGGESNLKKDASPYSDIYIAFNSNQIKLTSNENPTENEDIRYSKKIDEEYMDAVKANDMTKAQELVDQMAKRKGWRPRHTYHGTLAYGFTVFDKAKAHVGGNSGAGFYFSTNEDDSGDHYADIEGADNHFKMLDFAERIFDAGEWNGVEVEDIEHAQKLAKAEMTKTESGTYDVYLKYDKPYIRDYGKSTNIYDSIMSDFDPEDYVSREDYDDEYDYDDAVFEEKTNFLYDEIQSAVYSAMSDMRNTYDDVEFFGTTSEDFTNKIVESAFDYERLTWDDIQDAVYSLLNGDAVYVVNDEWNESGDGTAEFVRAIIEELGYDAIEDKEVSTKFGQLSREMATETEHIIVFHANQIKSAEPVTRDENGEVIPVTERFNTHSEDLRYSKKSDKDYLDAVNRGDMETAQRMVDEEAKKHGYDIKAYHGTTEDFNKFSRAKWGKEHNGYLEFGAGFYFTPSEKEANRWAERGRSGSIGKKTKVMSVYLSSKKAVKADDPIEGGSRVLQTLGLTKADADFIAGRTYRFINYLIEDKGFDNVEVQEELKSLGFDAIDATYGGKVGEPSGQYVVFDPEQVKSADPVTYDDDGKVIPLSQRFNDKTDDIRFSKKAKKDILKLGGIVTDGGSVIRYSRKSWAETDKARLKGILVENGFSSEEVDRWIADLDSISANVLTDYKADRSHNALKKNSEYYYTLDLSTLCAKRRLYQGTYDAIMKQLPNAVLLPKDAIHIRALMADRYEVPCGICYEESRKKNEAKFANQWLNGYKTKNTEWAGYANMEHEDPYIPTLYDVLSTSGRSRLRAEHPEALESYLTFQKGRGSANPKVSLLHTDYRNDILNLSHNDVEKLNHIGGLRIQSFSDFEIPHVLDMMQAVLDMSAMKLRSQAYTKVPAFAQIFGNTGIKINLSLIGKAVDGKLVFDDKEGIDHKRAFKLRRKFDNNVGTILVGANPESVLLAWADPRIDMVIPFHRSGWSKAEFKALGLDGYEDFQKYQSERYILSAEQANELNEKEKPKKKYKAGDTITLAKAYSAKYLTSKEELYSADYWDGNLSGTENAKRYLKICAEQHRRPVFYELLQDNGDGTWSLKADGSTDGYWKSLIDFKMYDTKGNFAPQKEVRPVFNMQSANDIMNSHEGDPDTLPVAQDVVDQFVKDFKGGRKYKLVDDQKILDKDLPKITKDVKKSIKVKEDNPKTIEYQRTIDKLEEKVADLKAEFKRTKVKDRQADPKQVKTEASRLIKRHDSNMSIHGTVVEAMNEINKLYREKGDKAFDDAIEIAERTAVDVVNNITVVHDEGAEDYKAIKDYLRNTPIVITEDMKRNITDFNDFRKKNFGKLKLVNGDTGNIDNVYMELSEMFPEQFTEDYVNPADQLYHMVDVLDNFAPFYETLDGASKEMQDYVVEIAYDIMTTAYDLKAKKTFADKKYEEKLEAVRKARQKALESRKKALNKMHDKYAEKLKASVSEAKAETREEIRTKAEKKKLIRRIATIHARLTEKLLRPSDTKHLPDGYDKAVANVLKLFDFTTPRMEKWSEKHGRPSKRLSALVELRDQLEKLSEDGADIEVDNDLIPGVKYLYDAFKRDVDEETDTRLSSMTNEELFHIERLFEAFEFQINSYNKAFDENNKKRIEDTAEKAYEEMNAISHGNLRLGLMGKFTSNYNPTDFFKLIGGEIEGLYKSTRKGFDRYEKNLARARDFVQGLVDASTATGWDNHTAEYKTASGEKITLTDSQLMSLYCLLKREQAQGHIFGQGVVSAPVKVKNKLTTKELEKTRVLPSLADVTEWLKSLSDEQIKVAEAVQKFFVDESSEWGNETSMKLYGYKKFTEKSYFPIQSSQDFLNDNFDAKGNDPTLKNISPTKALVEGANNPLVLDSIFSVFTKHVAQMASYNAYVPAITDFTRVWNHKMEMPDGRLVPLSEVFENTYGQNAKNYVKNFFADLNGVYKKNLNVTTPEKLFGLFKKSAVGGNIRVLMQQPMAIARAMLILNPAYLTASVPATMKEAKATYKEMLEHCPIAEWKTWGFYSTDITGASRDLKNIMLGKDSISDKLFMNMYGVADNITWTVIFRACKMQVKAQNKGIEVGSDEYWEKVNELASEVFDRTQVVDSPFHRSELMKSQNGLHKIATAFMAEPTKTINMMNTEIELCRRALANKEVGKATKIMTRLTATVVANAMLLAVGQSLVDAMRGVGGGNGDDDDKGDFWQRFKKHWWSNTKDNLNIAKMIPYAKDVYSLIEGYSVTRMDMNGVEKAVKSIKQLAKYYIDPSSTKYSELEVWNLCAQGMLYALGVPVSNVWRDAKSAFLTYKEATGNYKAFFNFAKVSYQLGEKTESRSIFADMYYDALERGDKALAKEIYSYMIQKGVTKKYIDGRKKTWAEHRQNEE